MKDMLDPFLSDYSGVLWSAPDDATVEGEFQLAQLSLRYAKAQRRLRLRMTEISALETWTGSSEELAAAPERKLSGRGELAEVLTVFELNGGPVRQFQEVKTITIIPTPVQADEGRRQRDGQEQAENAGSRGALFIDFEALKIHGEHLEPELNLTVAMGAAEFQKVYALVRDRPDEIKEVTLVLEADLFGDAFEPDDTPDGWLREYGMLRPADAPLVFAAARLERLEVLLERSRVLGCGPATSARPGPDHLLGRRDPPGDRSSIITRQLGWIIALLVVIIVILLSGEEGKEGKEGTTRLPRQFAESPASAVMQIGSAEPGSLKASA
jgi:hypothetical protein